MVTFVESPLFTKQVHDYLQDDEYRVFQAFLATNPDAGDMVRGSGGVRKVRWSRRRTGKSGGVRILYFVRTEAGDVSGARGVAARHDSKVFGVCH